MDAFKLFVQQLFKNFEKQPGWIPLLLLCYIAVPALRLLDHAAAAFRYPKLSDIPVEALAVVLTYVFYLWGDALDKAVYKKKNSDGSFGDRFKPVWLQSARKAAQAAFGVGDGIYAASIALTAAAEKEFPRMRIHIANESAKFLRSLVIPLLGLTLYYFYQWQLLIPALLLLIAGSSAVAYVYLKLWHMRDLYTHVVQLKGTKHFLELSLEGVRLFFWDGTFVSSAKLAEPAPRHSTRPE
jgi:hypothetical protein